MKRLFKSIRASIDITSVVVDVVLVCALIPVLAVFIGNSRVTTDITWFNATDNLTYLNGTITTGLSTTEMTILGLTTLFIVLALVFNIARQSGLIKKS